MALFWFGCVGHYAFLLSGGWVGSGVLSFSFLLFPPTRVLGNQCYFLLLSSSSYLFLCGNVSVSMGGRWRYFFTTALHGYWKGGGWAGIPNVIVACVGQMKCELAIDNKSGCGGKKYSRLCIHRQDTSRYGSEFCLCSKYSRGPSALGPSGSLILRATYLCSSKCCCPCLQFSCGWSAVLQKEQQSDVL